MSGKNRPEEHKLTPLQITVDRVQEAINSGGFPVRTSWVASQVGLSTSWIRSLNRRGLLTVPRAPAGIKRRDRDEQINVLKLENEQLRNVIADLMKRLGKKRREDEE